MTTETKESDLLANIDTATLDKPAFEQHPLHLLQQEIAAMPAIDREKVESAIRKLRNGGLDILGTEQQREASAQRIAKQIMDESSDCDSK